MSTFELLIKDYKGLIYKVINKYSIKGYDDDDKYQEAVTKLYEEYTKYDDKYKFSTFLYVILDNHFKDLVRNSNTQNRSNKVTVDGKLITISDVKNFDFDLIKSEVGLSSDEIDAINIFGELLMEEPLKRNRYIIGFRYYRGYTLKEVGDKFNVSKQRVKQICDEFIKKVQKELTV